MLKARREASSTCCSPCRRSRTSRPAASRMIYADEVVVSHTNENEYNALRRQQEVRGAAGPHHPGARCPTTCASRDEVRIYEKLLGQSALKDVHIAPHTLRVATIFAILSRLEPSKKAGMSLDEEAEALRRRGRGGLQAEGRQGAAGGDRSARAWTASRRATSSTASRARWSARASPASTRSTRCARCATASSSTPASPRRSASATSTCIDEARKEYDEMAKTEVQTRLRLLLRGVGHARCSTTTSTTSRRSATRTKLKDPITDEESSRTRR